MNLRCRFPLIQLKARGRPLSLGEGWERNQQAPASHSTFFFLVSTVRALSRPGYSANYFPPPLTVNLISLGLSASLMSWPLYAVTVQVYEPAASGLSKT